MSLPDLDTRKHWWLCCYGLSSMQHAVNAARELMKRCDSNRDPMFYFLVVAAHTFYARPFMDNSGAGRIEADFVPPELRGIHKCMMSFRCKAYSHTDTKPIEDTDETWNDVVYKIDEGIKEISTKTCFAEVSEYEHFINHCEIMDQVFCREIFRLHDLYSDYIPKDKGDFELKIDIPSNPLFIPYVPRKNAILHFKG